MGGKRDDSAFSYTAKRGAFWGHAGGWAMLFVIEGSIIALLIVIFAPGLWLKLGLVALLAALIGYVIVAILCGPLWSHHRLEPDALVLHYGRATFAIPRANIASAAAVDGKISEPFRAIPAFDEKTTSLVVTFSDMGVVALNLVEPQTFVLKEPAEPVNRIVFNVDRREVLLDALDPDPPVSAKFSPPSVSGTREAWPPVPSLRVEGGHTPFAVDPVRAPAIAAQGLERRFGDATAVADLDLAIHHGEIYGFLGANGAGKTTTLKMLVGLLAPTAGEIRIAGHDIDGDGIAAKRALGYVPDRAILYDRLSGKEFLAFLAQMRGISRDEAERRIDHLLALFELTDREDSPSGSYSYGMKRKLALAGALIHEPTVLILDEPLNGLDPRSARRLKDLFAELSRDGVGILLSTHDLATAEAVCDRIGIIHRGRLLAEGTVEELTSGAPGDARTDLESVFLQFTGELIHEPAHA